MSKDYNGTSIAPGVNSSIGDKWGAYIVETARAKGASQAEIDAAIQQGKDAKAMLENPLINAAVTFTHPLGSTSSVAGGSARLARNAASIVNGS